MTPFLTHWVTTALALGAAAWILPGVTVTSMPALAVAALVLGLINAVVKPVLVLLTLPITVLTLGLFYLVVNGLAFSFAPGWCRVCGPVVGWAMLGALLVGMVSMFIGSFRRPTPVKVEVLPPR